jgi:hypothetical protein
LVATAEEIERLNGQGRASKQGQVTLGNRTQLLRDESPPVKGLIQVMNRGWARQRERAGNGARVYLDGRPPPASWFDEVQARQDTYRPASSYHLVTEVTHVRCHPTEQGLYEYAGDVDFDLLLCSTLRPGEVVRLVSRHRDDWVFVQSSYDTGWLPADQLGPEVSPEQVASYLEPERWVVVTGDRIPLWATPERRRQRAAAYLGQRLPLLERQESMVQLLGPTDEGLQPVWVTADEVHEGYLPMTRRHLWSAAFARLDDAFGWGGAGGDRDCSRLLMDVFALFGLHLPRNSARQSQVGSQLISLADLSAEAKRRALTQALEAGIVLLYMPGHIMLYLGRDGNHDYALHQFSGYREGCGPGQDVKMAVNRVSVTTLALGAGSERRSFLDRLTQLMIIGRRQPTE